MSNPLLGAVISSTARSIARAGALNAARAPLASGSSRTRRRGEVASAAGGRKHVVDVRDRAAPAAEIEKSSRE